MKQFIFFGVAFALIGSAGAANEIVAVKSQVSKMTKLQPSALQAVLRLGETTPVDALQPNLLNNPQWTNIQEGKVAEWMPWGDGYELAPNAGAKGQNAVTMRRQDGSPALGIGQRVQLDQKTPQAIVISGQSKAENVSGSKNSDYALYADVFYQDGSTQWGLARPFDVGTHDWQQLRYEFSPSRPVKSIILYALFRDSHIGQVWFCDLAVKEIRLDDTVSRFDGQSIASFRTTPTARTQTYSTSDGLTMNIDTSSGAATELKLGSAKRTSPATVAGFVARDVANDTGYYALSGSSIAPLRLSLEKEIKSTPNAIAISGRVQNQSVGDRAVSVAYTIPLDAIGWQWGDDIGQSRTITAGQEYSKFSDIGIGSNGKLSVYPMAALWNGDQGIALCLDMNQAAQFRVAYSAYLKCLYIVYDFGLTPEKAQADFRFVIYRFDGRWGYRAAVAKMYALFPELFEVRGDIKKQGLWMPFTSITSVQDWQDFGFRFREGGYDEETKRDDENGILTFRYSEPSTWWMPMSKSVPREYSPALEQARSYLGKSDSNGQKANALMNSGMRFADGTLAAAYLNRPWGDGAVWGFNTSPALKGEVTGAKLVWSAERRADYSTKKLGALDGEYLDSAEDYMSTPLDFDRSHFSAASAPLSFDTKTHRPAVSKHLMTYELARQMHHDLKAMGKYLFANSTPYRVGFLVPWFDVLGTETNWNQGGNFSPSSAQDMRKRRTLSAQKPYCLLQNTNMDEFAPFVEKYFQRSHFYGMFPGFFSADAATSPYWRHPKWYNRDRALFKKYIPLIQNLSAAGWQPVTLARSSNLQVEVERYGRIPSDRYAQVDAPHLYLTLLNATNAPQQTTIRIESDLAGSDSVSELIGGEVLKVKDNAFDVSLRAGEVKLLQLR